MCKYLLKQVKIFFLSHVAVRAICLNSSKYYNFRVILFKLKIKYVFFFFFKYKDFSKGKSFYLHNSVPANFCSK